jgi:putative addiction module component (TIGR02574 family)
VTARWRFKMANMLAELKEKAAQLSEPERADLALSLIESLDGPAEDPTLVEEAWRVEIERRVGELERGEVKPIPGDEVFAEIRRRLK